MLTCCLYLPFVCTGTQLLQQVLIFTTGLDSIPALGFNPQPIIEFDHDGQIFPKANTCTNTLRLPCLGSYEEFMANMSAALTTCVTFTAA